MTSTRTVISNSVMNNNPLYRRADRIGNFRRPGPRRPRAILRRPSLAVARRRSSSSLHRVSSREARDEHANDRRGRHVDRRMELGDSFLCCYSKAIATVGSR